MAGVAAPLQRFAEYHQERAEQTHRALKKHVLSHVPIERGGKRVILRFVQRAASTSIWFVFGKSF